jgi:UPF0716 family protein affecting phage T7 exclusion
MALFHPVQENPPPMPLLVVLIALIGLPFAEFAAFFVVAGRVTLLGAFALIIAGGFLGIALIRHSGGQVLARMRGLAADGRIDVVEVMEVSLSRLLAGVLFLIPGFVSDGFAVALLIAGLLRRRGKAPLRRDVAPEAPRRRGPGDVIDLDPGAWEEVDPRREIDDRTRRDR